MYILTDMYKYHFKFCFITNNSVNAKFLVRYIGLKLKRKFPLFTVINPLKKELKKLSYKKKDKKSNLLLNLFNYEFNNNKNKKNYKDSFKNVILYINDKYIEILMFYYTTYLTFVTFDIFKYFYLILNYSYY